MTIDGLVFTTFSTARGTFDANVYDIRSLLQTYDERPKRADSWRHVQDEAFLRSAVILTLTAWETFVEDSLQAEFSKRLASAKTPQDVKSAFGYSANRWLSDKPKPPSVELWTGLGWKSMINNQFSFELNSMNTPSTAVVRKLSKRFLDIDVTSAWKWQGVSTEQAGRRLDALIKHRGVLTHRGRHFADKKSSVSRKAAESAVTLICRLARRTEEALGTQSKEFRL